MSPQRALVVLAVVAFGFAATSSGQAAATEAKSSEVPKECVGDPARKALSECPGGPSKFDVKQKRGVAFKSAPPPRERKEESLKKPTNPTEEMALVRAIRGRPAPARARARSSRAPGSRALYSRAEAPPDRRAARRLAKDTSAEAPSRATRSERTRSGREEEEGNTEKFRRDAAQEAAIVKAARNKAIAYYTKMKTDYPNYSKLDEVLYYLAYEHEQAGDLKNARTVYYELIQKAPKSSYIPNAYLAFGELFFVEAQGDPSKWDLAAAYKEVT